MHPVRFEFLEIAYGCHRDRFDLSAERRPFVIAGPNGAGKSTIIEALVRTIYGFRRRRDEDKRIFEERRPWRGGEYHGTVGLEGPAGRITVERDFETDEVVVRRAGEDRPIFEGEANPAGSGETLREYRRILERHFGLADLDDYERTACVHQDGLRRTTLGEDLLQLAAGGHADVETAREELHDGYRRYTVEPIDETEKRRRKPGEVERAVERLEEIRERRDEARAAEARRAPLAERRDELRRERARVGEEIALLERAYEGVSRVEALEARKAASEQRLSRLEDAQHDLDEALARVELLEVPRADDERRYPEDFLERAAVLEEGLWPLRTGLETERGRLEAELEGLDRDTPLPPVPVMAAGLTATAIGVAIAWAGPIAVGLTLVVVGVAGVVAGLRWRRAATARAARRAALAEVEGELSEVRRRIANRLDGIPESATLGPETLDDRRREFRRQRQEAADRKAARDQLRRSLDETRKVLAQVAAEAERGDGTSSEAGGEPGREEEGDFPPAPARPVPRDETLSRRAELLIEDLQAAASEERNERLAPLHLELRRESRPQLDLPDGVRPTSQAVRETLGARRARATELDESLAEVERRIAYEGRAEESSVALDARLTEARAELERLERKAAALRHAYRLVADAYEEFRQTDQERLLEAISGRLRSATAGALGPLACGDRLEEAEIVAGDRQLPMSSPPLSYGQLHIARLAIRMGAADFLAGLGVRVPLLVDDPFVHLDEARAARVWRVLCRVAAERQVVVATQDSLVLGHLGIDPDLALSAAEPEEQASKTAAESEEQASKPAAETEPRTLDLWGQPSGE